MTDPREEFYVGYLKKAPAGLARYVRSRVMLVIALAALVAVLLVSAQDDFPVATFEYGNVRSFTGYVSERPYPTLLVKRPSIVANELPFSRYLLVAPGKIGGQQILEGFDGHEVTIDGTLIYRDDQTMIEVVPGSVKVSDGGRTGATREEELGRFTLHGEIVDSKCFLGVMKPGNIKPHRACAVRCISGGIPPVFLVRDDAGNALYPLLVGADGRMLNKEVLDVVAVPLAIDGVVTRLGSTLILRAEPSEFRRL